MDERSSTVKTEVELEHLRAQNHRLERENQALRDQAKRALAFAQRAAHDLKGPARKIEAFARLLQVELPKNLPASARAQRGLERNVSLLRDTIDEYLRSSLQRPTSTETSVDDLLAQVLRPLRAQYPNVDVTFASFGRWTTDPTALKRILHNVIENACKFTNGASHQPHRVHIDGQHHGGYFMLTVDDNGCGQASSAHHPARGHGIGLDSLESDLADLDATLTLRDRTCGTRCDLRLPLPA